MTHLIYPKPDVVPDTLYLMPIGNHNKYWDGKPIVGTKVKETYKYVYVTIERSGRTSDPMRMSRDYKIDDTTGYGGYLVFPYLDWFEAEMDRREKMNQIHQAWSAVSMGGGLSCEAANAIYNALVADGYIKPTTP